MKENWITMNGTHILVDEDNKEASIEKFLNKHGKSLKKIYEKAKNDALKTDNKGMEKPEFITGFFNGKIYGNEKYGFRIYIDGKEKKITPDQKKNIEQWQKNEAEKKAQKAEQASAKAKDLEAQKNIFSAFGGVYNTAELAKKTPEKWNEWKEKNIELLAAPENIALLEKNYAKTPEMKAIIEKIKNDKDYAREVVSNFINEVEKVVISIQKQEEREDKINQERGDRAAAIINYIKAHGTPSILKNGGYWNGTVYGSKGNYSIYIDGKKRRLSKFDAEEFGLDK